jgi:hypothetical protein
MKMELIEKDKIPTFSTSLGSYVFKHFKTSQFHPLSTILNFPN